MSGYEMGLGGSRVVPSGYRMGLEGSRLLCVALGCFQWF